MPRPLMPFARLLSLTALVSATVFAVACQDAGAPEEAGGAEELVLETPQQRGSYAQGLGLGRQGQGMHLDVEAFIQGLRDGLGDESRLDDGELQQAMQDFNAFLSEMRDTEAEANLVAGNAFLAENAARVGVETTATGLQYEVIREGDGRRPSASDVVRVHYRGTTIEGDVFDESYGGDPVEFSLSGVIAGWTEGLQLMPVGSHYKFYLPTELAYGTNVRPGSKFGLNSALVFEIELLDIIEQ